MELVYIQTQTVPGGNNVIFNTSIACPKRYVIHEDGSGLVTLKGFNNNCSCGFVKYHCVYTGNMAITDGETVSPISIALSKNGETLPTSVAIQTPATAGAYNHVTLEADVIVPKGCCAQLALKNVSDNGTSINLQNSWMKIVA